MSHNRHPYSSPDNFGGGVHHTRSQKATIRAFDKFYSWFPSFLDMFPDEEAFVNFAFWIELLNKEYACVILLICVRGRSEANNAVGLQTIESMLHHDVSEDSICANLATLIKTNIVWSLKCKHRARTILYKKITKVSEKNVEIEQNTTEARSHSRH